MTDIEQGSVWVRHQKGTGQASKVKVLVTNADNVAFEEETGKRGLYSRGFFLGTFAPYVTYSYAVLYLDADCLSVRLGHRYGTVDEAWDWFDYGIHTGLQNLCGVVKVDSNGKILKYYHSR